MPERKSGLLFLVLFFISFLTPALLHAEPTVLILGDSLTEGTGVEKTEAYPHLVERFTVIFEEGIGTDVLNLSLQTAVDREVVRGKLDLGGQTRLNEGDVAGADLGLDQQVFADRPE